MELNSYTNNSLEKTNSYLKFDLQYFVNLDSENKICFDCGGPYPTHVSINNGVFICQECAKNHAKLGYNISFLQRIDAQWDEYLLGFATRGGNFRFKRLCMEYEVPCQSLNENDEEKLNKYIIRLGEYYRLVLRSEILAEEPPPILYKEVAKQPANLKIIYFPEFENYHLSRPQNPPLNTKNSIGGKIWNGTKTTVGAVGVAGGYAYKIGKPIVCFLGKNTYKGIKYLGGSLWNHYMNNNNSNNKGEKNKNNNTINEQSNNQAMNNYYRSDYSEQDLNKIKTVSNMNLGYNENLNQQNNIIFNDNYINNYGYQINSNNSSNNINEINNFEVVHPEFCKEKEYNNSSASLFDNNTFAGMNVQFENTDKVKARKDANNFLLKY